jgi:hypothetical protein
MVTLTFESTRSVVTVKVRLVEPAGMVTLDGTDAREVLLLDRLTTAPPLGAGAVSVLYLSSRRRPSPWWG